MSDLAVSSVGVMVNDTEMRFLDRVSDEINRAVLSGNPNQAFRFAQGLQRAVQLQGVSLAKFLFEMQSKWHLFQVEDEFYETLESELGISTAVADKYINMYRRVLGNEAIPAETRRKLMGKPIEGLLKVVALEGEIGDEDWAEIAQATSVSEMRQIARNIRGASTSSETALLIQYEKKSGQLKCRIGSEGPFAIFGFLNELKREEDPAVDRAIERLLRECHVMVV
jgi:hypothetical protein